MDGVVRVVGQGAAVPHRGLSNVQDLVAHRLLRTSRGGSSGKGGGVVDQKGGREGVKGRQSREGREEVKRGRWVGWGGGRKVVQ